MVKVEKKLLEKTVEVAVCENKGLKNCGVLYGGSIYGNCKNAFGNKVK